jgi:valine dehydrogenase (NAD+)
MDIIAKETRFVTGRSVEHGGCGDSSVLTALGVFQGMRAAAEHLWGTPTLSGRRVGIAGVGKVGKWLTDHLIADGADVGRGPISTTTRYGRWLRPTRRWTWSITRRPW